MYEILSAILLIILGYVIYRQTKEIEIIVASNTEFYTAYAEYVKAISEHNKIVREALTKLDSNYEKSYYAITALAAHTEYLEGIVWDLEDKLLGQQQMIEYIDKRLMGVEQNGI